MNHLFRRFAHRMSEIMGSPWAFITAALIILMWAIAGPYFAFSTAWQIMVNTGTTILTFLMVFLIQNTQNRDAHAIHLKLDELIKAIDPARDTMIDIEDLEDEELAMLQEEFKRFRAEKIAEIMQKRSE